LMAAYAGTTQTYSFVSSGSGKLKATLCWTDPPPTLLPGPARDDPTPVLVNDLDLAVVGPPGATTYFPGTRDPTNPGLPSVRTVRNSVDNVEQVLIDAPPAGTYQVQVRHSGSVTSQVYSLFVSVDRGCATCPGDLDGNNIADGRDIALFA